MRGEVKLVTARVVPALRIEDVKSYLKVNSTADDFTIKTCIDAAADTFDAWTNKILITQTYMTYFEDISAAMQLRRGNYQSLVLIEYLLAGVWTSYETSNFNVDVSDDYPVVLMQQNASAPNVDQDQPHPVRVTFKAGYGDKPNTIPPMTQLGLLQLILFVYQNRGDYDQGKLPSTLKLFLDNNKVRSLYA